MSKNLIDTGLIVKIKGDHLADPLKTEEFIDNLYFNHGITANYSGNLVWINLSSKDNTDFSVPPGIVLSLASDDMKSMMLKECQQIGIEVSSEVYHFVVRWYDGADNPLSELEELP